MESLAVIIPILVVLSVVLLVLAILIPWFVFRISTYTRETRDLLKGVKKDLHLANEHLAVMANDLEHLSDLEVLKARHTDQSGD